MNLLSSFWLIPFYPLAGTILCLLLKRYAAWIASALVGLSFLHGLAAAFQPRSGALLKDLHEWMPGLMFRLQFDDLTSQMVLLVAGIGFLIHVYSIDYMKGEDGYWRYFACLNLFVFFMLLLVMASNLGLLFAGWEGVGLASYLLIGFHHDRPLVNRFAMKAFLYNRAGDAGFLLGIFLLLQVAGSVEFQSLAGLAASPELLVACLLLALGATGKSAQLPLFVWLPDAMVGPTPVSALIHAATMVTAGVYLFARLGSLYALFPEAGLVIAAFGALTALIAATVALVENDIKKVLAWSTISQLGLMFMACGLGHPGAAMFHVTTHAFFKALLFLCAGNIIHALNGEQDLRYMGGLRAKMPWTFRLMSLGALALAGVPGLAGFFSKDAILIAAADHWGFLAMGLTVSVLTALYCGRLLHKVFWGDYQREAHEAHGTTLYTLWPLAIGAAGAGYWQAGFHGPVWIPLTAGALAIGGVWWGKDVVIPDLLAAIFKRRWYVDALYERVFADGVGKRLASGLDWLDRHLIDLLPNALAIVVSGASLLSGWLDRFLVDGLVRLTGVTVEAASYPVRLLANGRVPQYAFGILLGLGLMLAFVLSFGGTR